MSLNTLDDRVQEVARQVFGDDDLLLTDATAAADVPEWDSLAHVNFIYGLEEAFGVEFSEDELIGFENVGELKGMLRQKIGSA
jgi:acyl carrier protein